MKKQSSSSWRTGVWVTRFAAILGVFAIVAGLFNLHLLVIPLLRMVAFSSLALAAVAVLMALWGINRSSLRLRRRAFWGSLLLDLALIAALSALCLKASRLPAVAAPYHPPSDIDLPNAPP